jgi:hypothetical protein
MERFYNNEDDNDDDESFFGSDDEFDQELTGEVVGYIDQQGIINVMQMDLAQTELNQHLLSKAIEIAKDSWFWCFKSVSSRLTEIETVYKRLLEMTGEEIPEISEIDDIDYLDDDDLEGN